MDVASYDKNCELNVTFFIEIGAWTVLSYDSINGLFMNRVSNSSTWLVLQASHELDADYVGTQKALYLTNHCVTSISCVLGQKKKKKYI